VYLKYRNVSSFDNAVLIIPNLTGDFHTFTDSASSQAGQHVEKSENRLFAHSSHPDKTLHGMTMR
jgi:hypothetical protein